MSIYRKTSLHFVSWYLQSLTCLYDGIGENVPSVGSVGNAGLASRLVLSRVIKDGAAAITDFVGIGLQYKNIV